VHDDESGQAGRVRELLERTIAAAGVTATVQIEEREDGIVATLVGDDLGVMIGRHGQTIDALQYLANAIGYRTWGEERVPVVVDAAGYRARRAASLESLARRGAERAVATGARVELEPMTAVERKIVHELLKDDPEVDASGKAGKPVRGRLPRRSAGGPEDVLEPGRGRVVTRAWRRCGTRGTKFCWTTPARAEPAALRGPDRRRRVGRRTPESPGGLTAMR
jgi:spoIIIJ-associated protein